MEALRASGASHQSGVAVPAKGRRGVSSSECSRCYAVFGAMWCALMPQEKAWFFGVQNGANRDIKGGIMWSIFVMTA